MRKISTFLALSVAMTLSLAANCQAEEAPADTLTSLQPGMWALSFRITNDFGLMSLDGTSISMRRVLSEHSAVRVGVSLSAGASDSDELRANDDRTETQERDDSNDHLDISLSATYVRYSPSQGRARFYVGAGPIVSVGGTERSNSYVVTVPDSVRSTSDTMNDDDWSVGAEWVTGVEWFATREISLHSEYCQRFSYTKYSTSSTSLSTTPITPYTSSDRESTGWSFSPAAVRFGISVYF